MKTFTLLAAMVLSATLTAAVSAADGAAKPATIGGGVKNPWAMPYTVAVVTVPEPASVAVLGVGAAALLVRKNRRRR